MTAGRARAAARCLAALALAGVRVLGGASYVVSGTVVDSRSHAPLGNAIVSLAPSAAKDRKLEQVTKPDGRFSFAVSGPGKYWLTMTKPGYPPQAFKGAEYAAVATAIVVRDDQDTSNVVFDARHGGAVGGVVKDEDSEPVGNALVTLFQWATTGGERNIILRGQARADAAGEFRFAGMPPGSYYICATGRPWFADPVVAMQEGQRNIARFQRTVPAGSVGGRQEVEPADPAPAFSPDPVFRGTAFLTTFYPSARSVDQAALVRLEAGGEARVSITLPLTSAVTVKGTVSEAGGTGEGRVVLYWKVRELYISLLEAWVRNDRTFELKNVPPGSYEIVAVSQAGTGANSWDLREPVEVGASDVEVTLRPGQLSSLGGRVRFDGERPAPGADLFVSLRSPKGIVARAEVSPDGSYALRRIRAGQYEVTAGNADYLAAYLTGAGGGRLPLALTIAPGDTAQLDVTLTRAVAEVTGTVEDAGAPRVGACVLLLPKDAARLWAYRVDQTDSDGSYRLYTIPAGDYYLVAISEGDDVAFRDGKVRARLIEAGKPLHVDGGDHLDLKLDAVSTASLKLSAL